MQKNISILEKQVIKQLHDFLSELKAERAHRAVGLQASLEQDLGIGSIERAELFSRIEKFFHVQIPDRVIGGAKTVSDIVEAVAEANPSERHFKNTAHIPLETIELDVSSASTLTEVLMRYAEHNPKRPHIYLQDEQGDETIISYGMLLDKSQQVAKTLLDYGVKPSDTIALMLPTCEAFFSIYFGVLLVGAIPVPIYPPFRPDRIEEYAKREVSVLKNAEIRLLVTFAQAQGLSKLLQAFVPSLKTVVTSDELLKTSERFSGVALEGEEPAMIQYTSGSTGIPKGVLLTHHNLLANVRAAGKAIAIKPTDVMVSWLPLYHDMGLIGAWLGSLYHGIPVTIFSPLFFLNHPERWLWAIHYHRATISAGPNFAYELCVRKIDEANLEGLDLSSWRLALNGAEAIHPKTLTRFTEKFSPYGFKAETFFPVYGLAESSVALVFPPVGRKPRIDRISRFFLETEQRAEPAETNYLEFVCCGKAIPEHEVRIVNDDGKLLPERHVGNLQFSGPSSMQGYYRNPEATQAIYHQGWWESGDYAYVAEGEIFITGRKKDLIIKAGRNLFPESIESLVNQIDGIRKGCVVAFGVTDEKFGTEQLVIVAETHEQEEPTRERIINHIVEKITVNIGVSPDQVILVAPGVIPKTSSGKLQRSACKQIYLQEKLVKQRQPVWMQVTKLFFAGGAKKVNRWLHSSFKFLYAAYIGLILLLVAPVIWGLVVVLSRESAVKAIKVGAQLIFILAGCPITVSGIKNIKENRPSILVANHASYIDTLLLLAVLPPNFVFVGKKELLQTPILNTIFRKLEFLTVDRWDFSQNLADVEKIKATLKKGHSIVIFPEGTFTYATGLRPFKYGAFKVAVDTSTPICPVALAGTRSILRDVSWLPRRGAMKVTIGELILPREKGWHEVVHLRELARTEIAKSCGEQSLDALGT